MKNKGSLGIIQWREGNSPPTKESSMDIIHEIISNPIGAAIGGILAVNGLFAVGWLIIGPFYTHQ
jgi:hypothetical protein